MALKQFHEVLNNNCHVLKLRINLNSEQKDLFPIEHLDLWDSTGCISVRNFARVLLHPLFKLLLKYFLDSSLSPIFIKATRISANLIRTLWVLIRKCWARIGEDVMQIESICRITSLSPSWISFSFYLPFHLIQLTLHQWRPHLYFPAFFKVSRRWT